MPELCAGGVPNFLAVLERLPRACLPTVLREHHLASPSRSGVFAAEADQRLERFAQSIEFDRRLYRHDIRGSIVHARMLERVRLLTADEAEAIVTTLGEIEGEIDRGEFRWRIELEDIHMHIEQALIDRLGDVGRKLHTGRSRNDQVTTATRLWLRDELDRLDGALAALQAAFVSRCDDDFDVVLPAYTHFQRAQPVLAPHYWLAYCERFQRDRERLHDARKRVNTCTLGTAALAGSSLPLDREYAARELGFERLAENSLDASFDRDFIAETLAALALLALHLSGWAEEWILWSTAEYGFLQLPHAFCTGSSIMPQKINPDVLELIRGKTGRVIGDLQTVLVLIKGLPLAYNRDFQEDKPPLFDAVDTVASALEIAEPIVRDTRLDRDRISRGLETGYLDATTLMEWMIARGIPQRTAHHAVGQLVQQAMGQGVPLKELPLGVFAAAGIDADETVYEVLGTQNAVRAFRTRGSTAPTEVRARVAAWRRRLAADDPTDQH